MESFEVSFAFFCLLGASACASYFAFFGRHRLAEERMSELGLRLRLEDSHGNPEELASLSYGHTLLEKIALRLPAPKFDSPRVERLVRTLAQAGFTRRSAVQSFQAVQFLTAAGGVCLGLLAGLFSAVHGVQTVAFMTIGGAFGSFLPLYFLKRRAETRKVDIGRQLSDALDLLVVCVEAGLGLYEAIRVVASETARQGQEIGTELSAVSAEVTTGKSLGHALRAMADRTAVEEVKPLAATLIQSEQLGAQIAPALRAISDTQRNNRRIRAEEEAQRTTIKILFPLVLFVLPAMIMVIVGPAFIQILRVMHG